MKFGVNVTKEPKSLLHALRPDGLIATNTPIIYDFSFVDSTLYPEQPQPLNDRAKQKHAKYDTLAETHHVSFVPLVFDVYGTTHQEVDVFVHTLCSQVPSQVRSVLKRSLYVMFQQASAVGSARILQTFARRISCAEQLFRG